jgi:hypothetical protein
MCLFRQLTRLKITGLQLIPNCGKFLKSTELQIFRMWILILFGIGGMQGVGVGVDILFNVFHLPPPPPLRTCVESQGVAPLIGFYRFVPTAILCFVLAIVFGCDTDRKERRQSGN